MQDARAYAMNSPYKSSFVHWGNIGIPDQTNTTNTTTMENLNNQTKGNKTRIYTQSDIRSYYMTNKNSANAKH